MSKVIYNPVSDKILLYGMVFWHDCIFGQDTLQTMDYEFSYIVSLNPDNGAFESINTFPGALNIDWGHQLLDIDENGDIYFITWLWSDTTFFELDTFISNAADILLWKTTDDCNVKWIKQITGLYTLESKQLMVQPYGDIYFNLSDWIILTEGNDTLSFTPNQVNAGIMQVDTAGNFIRMIGTGESRFFCQHFNFIGNDLVVHGLAYSDSIGNWPVDEYFIGRYHPYPLAITQDNNKWEDIEVFPNPVNKILNIHSSKNLLRTEIYSINGQLLRNQLHTNNKIQIDVSMLPPGNYFIRAICNNEVFVRKFIIIR